MAATDADGLAQLWQQRSKHIFILSSAGKPIFTRYGDESDFSELFGIFSVLLSMAQQRSGDKVTDHLRRVTAGPGLQIHFYTNGELSYVMVTRTEESARSCIRQLKLIHLQLVSVLPTVNDILRKSPGYDVRRVFTHREAGITRQLIKRMSNELPYYFRAPQAAALPLAVRKALGSILVQSRVVGRRGSDDGEDESDNDHAFSLLLFRGKVVASVGPKGYDLHPDDVLLLLNFTSCVYESPQGEFFFAPLCLPRFNDEGYLHCYCKNVSVAGRALLSNASSSSATSAGKTTMMSTFHTNATSILPTDEIDGANGLLLVQLATAMNAIGQLEQSGRYVVEQLAASSSPATSQQASSTSSRASTKQQPFPLTQLFEVENSMVERNGALPIPSRLQEEGLLWYGALSETRGDTRPYRQFACSALPPILAFSKPNRKAFCRLITKLRDNLSMLSRAPTPLLISCLEQYSIVIVTNRSMKLDDAATPNTAATAAPPRSVGDDPADAEGGAAGGGDDWGAGTDILAMFLPAVPKDDMVRVTDQALRLYHSQSETYCVQNLFWKEE